MTLQEIFESVKSGSVSVGYGAGYLAVQINRLAAGADEKGN